MTFIKVSQPASKPDDICIYFIRQGIVPVKAGLLRPPQATDHQLLLANTNSCCPTFSPHCEVRERKHPTQSHSPVIFPVQLASRHIRQQRRSCECTCPAKWTFNRPGQDRKERNDDWGKEKWSWEAFLFCFVEVTLAWVVHVKTESWNTWMRIAEVGWSKD